jgi:Protein of unknown function (DUF3047)
LHAWSRRRRQRSTDDAVARIYIMFRHPPEALTMAQRAIDEMMRTLYGEAPPPVSGVALMTDADNTASSAIAYYGDITLSLE